MRAGTSSVLCYMAAVPRVPPNFPAENPQLPRVSGCPDSSMLPETGKKWIIKSDPLQGREMTRHQVMDQRKTVFHLSLASLLLVFLFKCQSMRRV